MIDSLNFEFFRDGGSLLSLTGGSFWEMIRPPEDIGPFGEKIMWLFNYATLWNLFYFILVCIGIFGFTYVYHHKRHPKAYYTYGNKKMHGWVTLGIGLAVFVSIDINITRVSNNDLLSTFWNWPDENQKVVRVEVLGQQWMWNFRYPGKEGLFNSQDDIVTANHLVVPKDTKVILQMTSKDVIHSLYIPNMRVKTDLLPGRITRMWFEANKEGDFDIACAEMCGTHHYLMKAKLTVMDKDNYAKWEKEARQVAIAGNDKENPDSFWGWKWGYE